MTQAHGETLARVIEATNSPYPASFDGSTIQFQLALFSMLSLSILGGMLFVWMSGELWKGRHEAYPWEGLFGFRAIIWLCSLGAVIRCGPEAAYMISYREGSSELLASILTAKRWLDAFMLIPGVTWMVLAWGYYPQICSQLVLMSRTRPMGPKLSKMRVRRLVCIILLIFIISALIAIGKR